MDRLNAAWVRVLLRYVIGAALMGSSVIGDQLAADPDLVLVLCGLAAMLVEGFYVAAKKYGWRL